MRDNLPVQIHPQSETESTQSLNETDNVPIFQSVFDLSEVDLTTIDPNLIDINAILVPEENNYLTPQFTATADVSAEASVVKNKETDTFSSTSKQPNYLQPLDTNQNNLMPRLSLVPQVNSSATKKFYQTFFQPGPINSSFIASPGSEKLAIKRPASEFPNSCKKVKITKQSYKKQKNEYGLSIPYFKDAEESCKKENSNWDTLSLEERRRLIQIKAKKIKKEINDEHKERVKTASSFKKT